MSPGDSALADATLLAVLRRAASPLRHDLAGALLVPRMRLQMLRRRAGSGALAGAELQAGMDEAIAALDAVRAAQRSALAWFEQHDAHTLALGDALAHAASALGLAAGERGLRIDWRGGSASALALPAQPLGLMLYAGFFHVLDHAPSGALIVLACGVDEADAAQAGARRAAAANASAVQAGACVTWRYELDGARSGEPAAAAPAGVVAGAVPALRGEGVAALCAEGVAALCARHGARFEAAAAGASLHLEASCP
jgi:hypothetical protein